VIAASAGPSNALPTPIANVNTSSAAGSANSQTTTQTRARVVAVSQPNATSESRRRSTDVGKRSPAGIASRKNGRLEATCTSDTMSGSGASAVISQAAPTSLDPRAEIGGKACDPERAKHRPAQRRPGILAARVGYRFRGGVHCHPTIAQHWRCAVRASYESEIRRPPRRASRFHRCAGGQSSATLPCIWPSAISTSRVWKPRSTISARAPQGGDSLGIGRSDAGV
jgi:hypothetical protein